MSPNGKHLVSISPFQKKVIDNSWNQDPFYSYAVQNNKPKNLNIIQRNIKNIYETSQQNLDKRKLSGDLVASRIYRNSSLKDRIIDNHRGSKQLNQELSAGLIMPWKNGSTNERTKSSFLCSRGSNESSGKNFNIKLVETLSLEPKKKTVSQEECINNLNLVCKQLVD